VTRTDQVEAEQDAQDVEALVAALCCEQPAARPTAAEALRHHGWTRVCSVVPRETAVCCIGAFCGGVPRDVRQARRPHLSQSATLLSQSPGAAVQR
jgi:hypothetical protein